LIPSYNKHTRKAFNNIHTVVTQRAEQGSRVLLLDSACGSVSDDESRESPILHITCVKGVPTLERIIKKEGIEQIILLELPLDKEGLKLVANTAKKTGVRLLVLREFWRVMPQLERGSSSISGIQVWQALSALRTQ
jgi:hypothetical protein